VATITFNTLENFNIPYDEIYFGKPYADFYIDDLAINPYHNLEKQLGFYKNNVQERNFNEIKEESINIIKKYSKKEDNKLKGEIHYYLSIPNEIKQFFPSLINYADNWYSMEKINGITFSYIFLDESLSDTVFLKFLNVLCTINSFDYSKLNIDIDCDKDIYENYCNKIRKRYSEYDYTKFENSSIIYEKLINYFDAYEKQKLGKMSLIHGDIVFSNCIIDENNNFKFIDMRGILGNKLTIFGDIYYDYAKVYQSLIGYDEILLDKLVSNNYRQNKIKIFETFVTEKFGYDAIFKIKMITNSLLFTLIPLHDDNKCNKYFNLIDL
jgi:aminoglycoside phosphotransferase